MSQNDRSATCCVCRRQVQPGQGRIIGRPLDVLMEDHRDIAGDWVVAHEWCIDASYQEAEAKAETKAEAEVRTDGEAKMKPEGPPGGGGGGGSGGGGSSDSPDGGGGDLSMLREHAESIRKLLRGVEQRIKSLEAKQQRANQQNQQSSNQKANGEKKYRNPFYMGESWQAEWLDYDPGKPDASQQGNSQDSQQSNGGRGQRNAWFTGSSFDSSSFFSSAYGASYQGRSSQNQGGHATTAATPPYSNCFEVLGLKPGAKKEEILNRFRNLAKKHHPDAGGSTAEFVRISKAKEEALKYAR